MTTWRGPWRFLTRAQLRFLDALCAKAKPWPTTTNRVLVRRKPQPVVFSKK